MTIVNVRIDGRLIHGQVAMLWVPSLGIDRVMVVGDEIAADDFGKEALKLAKPTGTNLSILPVEKAANNILAHRYDSQKVMIVTRETAALVALKKAGVDITEVNVGNVSNADGKTTIYKSVFLSPQEAADLRELNSLGVKLVHQMTPQVAAEDFMKALNEKMPLA
ncbi:MAG: PTS sugar transporter subunit IIB [Streptococcaceae bacterium]|nr:PTS sugar transporter subunit IIB [Streptococcaceae bacterium]